MNKDTFFPNRIIYFLLTILLAMVIDCPLIMFLKDENGGMMQTIFFVIFSITILLIICVVNIRKKNKILSFYTNRFDLLWLLFGLIFVKTHNLIFTVILHFWANAISWICTYWEIKTSFKYSHLQFL